MLVGGAEGRPNTLVLEVDEGDPWGTRGADRTRTVLGDDIGIYGIPGGYLRRPRYEQTDRYWGA